MTPQQQTYCWEIFFFPPNRKWALNNRNKLLPLLTIISYVLVNLPIFFFKEASCRGLDRVLLYFCFKLGPHNKKYSLINSYGCSSISGMFFLSFYWLFFLKTLKNNDNRRLLLQLSILIAIDKLLKAKPTENPFDNFLTIT